MSNLLVDSYQKIESVRGKKLVVLLISLFVTFTIVGILAGYLIHISLNKDEPVDTAGNGPIITKPVIESYDGRIEYVNPEFYGVSYVLVDDSGNDIFYLAVDEGDKKLDIADGLFVTVNGIVQPKREGDELDTLLVKEVIIRNAAN